MMDVDEEMTPAVPLTEEVEMIPSEEDWNTGIPESPILGSSSEPITLDPIDQQRVGLWILTQKDRPIVSLNDMKKFLELPEEESLKARIDELNERFEEDLDRFYLGKSEHYFDDAQDLYYSCDEGVLDEEVDKLYYEHGWKHSKYSQDEWNYIYRHITTTYNTRLAELTKGIRFPPDVDEYHRLPREIQSKVARFLLLDSDEKKEAMLSEYSWIWSQTTALAGEFERNPDFQKEIRSIVSGPVADASNVTDPRKRASLA
ncbi:hypothetical protein FB45DRAFT_907675 [Roridomyces roridus]|uniref:Uncharacterized protein n=1 Tax=Roridomyces roridus TaxID=1738132 RepID=A0AAD7C204_9AGAR|nr:hypothetical protein FB45DRAFT_907675 [Roridomyces roridus]